LAQEHKAAEFTGPGQDFAVVGTGVAGMSAAWLLADRHKVTVYERESRVGGHSHTVEAHTPRGTVPVDTGFIVYNEPNYPNLTALFSHLGVKTESSSMSFSVSLDGGAMEYAGGTYGGLLAQPSCLFRADYLAMLRDIVRFYREAPDLLAEREDANMSLGDYLRLEKYSDGFARLHLLPMGAAIWSSSLDDMMRHPLRAFVRFFQNHGLFKFFNRPQWQTVSGGSREYVKALTARYADKISVGNGVRAIERDAFGVMIIDSNGQSRRHDGVIIAAHADQALGMLAKPSYEESALLGAFGYRPNTAVLHSDRGLMPKRRMAWASWNYIGQSDTDANADLCVTYWMNRLQNIDRRTPMFLTLNPAAAPRDETIYGSYEYSHPMFNKAALNAQQRLWTLQGVNRTWYAGSYFGSGFHEDALQAGLAAAEDAGQVRRPWQVAKENGRIVLAPQLARAG
jgi:predicted NAD/FAD-binding protein